MLDVLTYLLFAMCFPPDEEEEEEKKKEALSSNFLSNVTLWACLAKVQMSNSLADVFQMTTACVREQHRFW